MKGKDLALRGLLLALALVLSWLESLLPLSFAVPGIKLGLPNLAVVFALYRLSWRDAALISLLRVLLISLLFGSWAALAWSAAGAALSLAVMALLQHTGKFKIAAVSVAGGVAHNLGQIAVAALLLETIRIVYYLPALLVSGTVAGVIIGLLSAVLVRRVGPGEKKGS